MYLDKKISVVVPVYNEARLICQTLSAIPSFVDRIWLIDDASTDATVAAALSLKEPRLRVIQHRKNLGVGAALSCGHVAAHAYADVVVVVGGDAQMNCAEMEKLLDPVIEGRADYAKGNRFTHPEVWKRIPFVRHLGMRGLSWLTKISSGYWHVGDSQCGYTAISSKLSRQIPWTAVYARYGYPNDLLAKLHCLKAIVVDVPIEPIYGSEQSGIRLGRSLIHMPKILFRAWWYRMTYSNSKKLAEAPVANLHDHELLPEEEASPRRSVRI
jgi:glycosyltransferase involved in cell wall biosynthesis